LQENIFVHGQDTETKESKECARQHKDDGHNREPRHPQFGVYHHRITFGLDAGPLAGFGSLVSQRPFGEYAGSVTLPPSDIPVALSGVYVMAQIA
jgi:hypothetical protein